jgi:hypothetical protein
LRLDKHPLSSQFEMKRNSVNHRFAVVTASAVGNWLIPAENATKVATTEHPIFESVIY